MTMRDGVRIGPFIVIEPIGRGAMGEVYLAFDPDLNLRFAVKVLAAELVEDEDLHARFVRELESMARLCDHPGIVKIQSAGRTVEGRPYFAMEYVEGHTLREQIRVGLGFEQSMVSLLEVAEALAYVHERGLVHRDLKPDNVLIGLDGKARLTDFGVAKVLSAGGAERGLTRTGEILGTPAYMAPEQVSPSAGEIGPWTDVYALGVLVYEAVSGCPPYVGATALEIYTELLDGTSAPRLRTQAPKAPRALDDLCAVAMAPNPKDRYQDAGAFLVAFRLALAAKPADSKRLLFVAAAAAIVCMVAGGAAVVVDGRRRAEHRVQETANRLESLQDQFASHNYTQTVKDGLAFLELGANSEVSDLVRRSRLAMVRRAFERDDAKEARALLEDLDGVEVAARPWIHAFVGEFDLALGSLEGESPRHVARLAAWGGELKRCVAALAEIRERSTPEADARANALAWEFGAFVPELPATASDFSAGGWSAVATAEEQLARGAIGLAELAFVAGRDSGSELDDAELELAATFGLLRVTLGQGRLDKAVLMWGDAWDLARDPLDRARCLAWGARLAVALEGAQELLDSLNAKSGGEDVLAAALKGAPGLPETQRAKAALAGVPRPAEDSSVIVEVALLREGRYGPGSRLAAQAYDLATLSLEGNLRAGAQQALAHLELALRLFPSSGSCR